MLAIVAGYPDGNDCDVLRDDPAFKMALDPRWRWIGRRSLGRRCARNRPFRAYPNNVRYYTIPHRPKVIISI
jgi:hypothetical protein